MIGMYNSYCKKIRSDVTMMIKFDTSNATPFCPRTG